MRPKYMVRGRAAKKRPASTPSNGPPSPSTITMSRTTLPRVAAIGTSLAVHS
jgi:hypothetical protein